MYRHAWPMSPQHRRLEMYMAGLAHAGTAAAAGTQASTRQVRVRVQIGYVECSSSVMRACGAATQQTQQQAAVWSAAMCAQGACAAPASRPPRSTATGRHTMLPSGRRLLEELPPDQDAPDLCNGTGHNIKLGNQGSQPRQPSQMEFRRQVCLDRENMHIRYDCTPHLTCRHRSRTAWHREGSGRWGTRSCSCTGTCTGRHSAN